MTPTIQKSIFEFRYKDGGGGVRNHTKDRQLHRLDEDILAF
jgi:hypothetical protein